MFDNSVTWPWKICFAWFSRSRSDCIWVRDLKFVCWNTFVDGLFSYSNIYVTSPAPENLKILFEFILKGFNALDYQDHIDYDIQYSSNDHKEKIIIQLTIHRPKQHRQVIQVRFQKCLSKMKYLLFCSTFYQMNHHV